jgi:hypothetical protein
MQILGHYFFEDKEDALFRQEWEEKRKQRVIDQCISYGMKGETIFWDLIQLPRKSVRFTGENTTEEDFSFHEKLMKRQECHVFYGKKYCYHTDEGERITDVA